MVAAMPSLIHTHRLGRDLAERPPNPDLFNLVCELAVPRHIGNPPINEDEYRDVLSAYHAARSDSNVSPGSGYAS